MPRTVTKVEQQIKLPTFTRVAAYTRVSSGKDAMLHSLSAQVSHYSAYIQGHKGWLYAGVYSDEAITGTKEKRDGFQRLLQDCRDGKIDLIITKSISRFARNTVTLLNAVRELKELGIDVYFEEQNIHTMSGEGELMLAILASFAQEESRSVSENLKWRYRRGFQNGEFGTFRFLYGYDIKKGTISVNPARAEIIREIYKRYLDGESLSAIAKRLNDRGITGIYGGRWYSTAIKDMLCNEKFTGCVLLQKTFINNHIEKKKIINKGELPQYYVEDSHPAIIDKETFDRVQAKLKVLYENTRHISPTVRPFTSMILCPCCGKNFKRVDGQKRPGWRCMTFCLYGKESCAFGKKLPEDTLMQLAAEVLGISDFDEDILRQKIDHIEVPEEYAVVFVFKDGHKVRKEWQERSRRESWTPEMRQVAREYAIEGNKRRKTKCQK